MEQPVIRYRKLYNVKSPTRGTKYSCGTDMYVPEKSEEYVAKLSGQNGIILTDDGFSVKPHGKVLIPSGLKISYPENYALLLENKSGIASKTQLVKGACLCDYDYENEIFINLINTSDEWVNIKYGQKIIQFYLIPCYYGTLIESESDDELFGNRHEKTRTGGFGSTGV